MRIAIVSAPSNSVLSNRGEAPDYVQGLAKGMISMGHHVDIIDAWKEDGMRLPGYEYIAVVTQPISFFSSKIPPVIAKVLAAGSSLVGKKSAAFVKKTGLFSNYTLGNLMRAMEKEGMRVNWSEILYDEPHAQAIGKRVGV